MGSGTSSASRSRSPLATGPAAPLVEQQQEHVPAAYSQQQQLAASLDAWKILVHAKQHYGQRLALVDCHTPAAFYAQQDGANLTTYDALHNHVLGLAGHLASLGIGRGSRVAVMLRNCAEVGGRVDCSTLAFTAQHVLHVTALPQHYSLTMPLPLPLRCQPGHTRNPRPHRSRPCTLRLQPCARSS